MRVTDRRGQTQCLRLDVAKIDAAALADMGSQMDSVVQLSAGELDFSGSWNTRPEKKRGIKVESW